MPAITEPSRLTVVLDDLLAGLFRKLELRDALSAKEREVLKSCASDVSEYRLGSDMVREGDRPSVSKLLVRGFASRYHDFPDGKRNIAAIHVSGDFVDLHSLLINRMDHSVGALSSCIVVSFPHDRLRELTNTHPHLTRLLWLSTLIDASIHRQWLLAAARSAAEQVAHLICELYTRLGVSGEAADAQFRLPITQVELAQALGRSPIHVNRTLQQMRARGLFNWQGNTLQILDWEALQRLGSFDPGYLHLTREPR